MCSRRRARRRRWEELCGWAWHGCIPRLATQLLGCSTCRPLPSSLTQAAAEAAAAAVAPLNVLDSWPLNLLFWGILGVFGYSLVVLGPRQ